MQQWVCLKREPKTRRTVELVSAGNAETEDAVHAIQLPHPKTSQPCRYFLQDYDTTLLEAQAIKPSQRSWFIGDSVQQDGRLFVLTPVHPNFILLPALYQARQKQGGSTDGGMFVSLDQLLTDPENPGLHQLRSLTLLNELTQICDSKSVDDVSYFRLNDEKLIAWLKDRVAMVSSALKVARAQIQAPLSNNVNEMAANLVADYLAEPWATRLLELHKSSTPIQTITPAPSALVAQTVSDAIAADAFVSAPIPVESTEKSTKKRRVATTAAAKANPKGMKQMSAYFSKDTAKP